MTRWNTILTLTLAMLIASPEARASSELAELSDVVVLIEGGLSEETIYVFMDVNGVPCNVTANDVLLMRDTGASETLIQYIVRQQVACPPIDGPAGELFVQDDAADGYGYPENSENTDYTVYSDSPNYGNYPASATSYPIGSVGYALPASFYFGFNSYGRYYPSHYFPSHYYGYDRHHVPVHRPVHRPTYSPPHGPIGSPPHGPIAVSHSGGVSAAIQHALSPTVGSGIRGGHGRGSAVPHSPGRQVGHGSGAAPSHSVRHNAGGRGHGSGGRGGGGHGGGGRGGGGHGGGGHGGGGHGG
jgi:hypothetical protein